MLALIAAGLAAVVILVTIGGLWPVVMFLFLGAPMLVWVAWEGRKAGKRARDGGSIY
ncbi:MAG: hypothetical protein AAGA90_23850 [Actinomycetota bacterium]